MKHEKDRQTGRQGDEKRERQDERERVGECIKCGVSQMCMHFNKKGFVSSG